VCKGYAGEGLGRIAFSAGESSGSVGTARYPQRTPSRPRHAPTYGPISSGRCTGGLTCGTRPRCSLP